MFRLLTATAALSFVACSSTPPAVTPPTCAAPQTACGQECADLQQNANHCGACDAKCHDTESCVKGACYLNDCAETNCSAAQVCPSGRCEDRACVGVVCAAGTLCLSGECVSTMCTVGACATGEVCVNNACQDASCLGVLCSAGAVCKQGRCETGTCSDGLISSSETDVDCGGTCPTKCGEGRGCATGADCTTAVCTAGHCGPAGTCGDGLKDGDETDLDCGGSCPTKCRAGQLCVAGKDCSSDSCVGGQCVQAATCANGVKDGTETDVDCGGADCARRCPDTGVCTVSSDCASASCQAGHCAGPSCTDGAKNGVETDTDCGGNTCPLRCVTGKQCLAGTDCVDRVCDAGTCQPPSCTDLVKNGTETDLDCGGSCARHCSTGQGCGTGTDCNSGTCLASLCAPDPTCADGVKNQDEVDVDCGGVHCGRCANGKACNAPGDCVSYICLGSPAATCQGSMFQGVPLTTPYASATNGPFLCVGRANNDAALDLVMNPNTGSSPSEVFMGSPGGQLGAPSVASSTQAFGGNLYAMGLLDVNGDGLDDHISIGPVNKVYVYLSNGDGTFQTGYTFPAIPGTGSPNTYVMATGDLDGDGRADLLLAWLDFNNNNRRLEFFRNQGDGGLGPAVETTIFTGNNMLPMSLAIGDFVRDGGVDVAVGSSVNFAATGEVRVLSGLGNGMFIAAAAATTTAVPPEHLVSGDFDGDGLTDVVIEGRGAVNTGWQLLKGNGAAGFAAGPAFASTVDPRMGLLTADYNRDGKRDLLVNGTLKFGLGNGTFVAGPSAPTGVGRVQYDANADGKPDLATWNGTVMQVWLGQ